MEKKDQKCRNVGVLEPHELTSAQESQLSPPSGYYMPFFLPDTCSFLFPLS